MKQEAKFYEVTPELAKKWLEKNVSNRSVNETKVNQFAEDMESGRWYANGEAIVFDVNWNLVNGQHRLSAVVKCGLTVKMLVVTGVPVEETILYDRGMLRATWHTLQMAGVDKYVSTSTVVAMVKLIYQIKYSQSSFSDNEIMDFVKKYTDQITTVRKITAGKTHKELNLASGGFMTPLFFALISGVDADQLKRFTEIVHSGFYDKKSETAAIVLRNDLIGKRIHFKTRESREKAVLSIEKAIFDFVHGSARKKSYEGENKAIYSSVEV